MWEALGDVIDWLWFPIMGALGAFLIEGLVLVKTPHLWDKEGNRYKVKMALAIFTGFTLAYVLQPSNVTQAFAIGAGWEVVLSSVAKEANTIPVTDGRVLRRLELDDLLKPTDTLNKALEKMQKAGTKDRIPVVNEEGRLMGLVTDGMIIREIENAKRDRRQMKTLEEIMVGSTEIVKVDQHDSVAKAIRVAEQQLIENKGQRVPAKGLPVIDHNGKVLGLLAFNELKALDRPLLGLIR